MATPRLPFIAAAALAAATLGTVAQAAVVTYSTSSSQLCVGAPGCGVATQTLFGSVTVSFVPVLSVTINAAPQSFASYGQLAVSCVGGGTACGNQSLEGLNLNLYINIAQTLPNAGNGSLSGGAITGQLGGTASTATIDWAPGTFLPIGIVRYRFAADRNVLVPPSTNAGVTTIQGLIVDSTATDLVYASSFE